MRVYQTSFLGLCLLCGYVPSAAQPIIADQGVTNAASYSILQASGGGLAPGSIMVIFGTGLGPGTLQSATGYPLQTDLAGTSVRIGNVSAFLVYSSATQIAAVVPSTVTPGTQQVTVTYNGRTSVPFPVQVIGSDFGIFTRNAAGYGQAAAQTVLAPSGELRTLGLATSVRPGEPVVLYGTGLGAIGSTPDDRPPGVARTPAAVQVIIGGKIVAPDYAGRSPNYPGLDQINFTAPPDLAAGCYVAVAVRANGRLSNSASIPLAQSGRLCPHPFSISEEAASRVDRGAGITIAQVIGERRSSEAGIVGEGAGIGFAVVDTNSLEITVDDTADAYASDQPGTCAVQRTEDNATVIRRPSVSRPDFLNAGPVVRLAGPSFATELPRSPDSTYGMNLPNGTLRAGTWTFSSAGGSDIAAFQMAAELPDRLNWTNRRDTIDPTQPFRIEWTTGSSNPIEIFLSSAAAGGQGRFAVIRCSGRAQDGSITIPTALVSMLPQGMGGITLTQAVTRTGYSVPIARGGAVDGSLFRITDQTSGQIRVQ